jgi:tRNA (guanine37-N1)-methyltransferase
MIFDVITIFPGIFGSYFSESIIKRALNNKVVNIKIHNLREFTSDRHKTVDDTPYGGGAGMIMKIEPIFKAVSALKKSQIPNPPPARAWQWRAGKSQINPKSKIQNSKIRVVLFSAKGKKYTQVDARRLSKYDNLILICGRYEGIDERVAKHIADEETSIGDYILTGGEIPAMILVDSITRLLPGALGNPESLSEESFSKIENCKLPARRRKALAGGKIVNCRLEYAQYTRPENFRGWKVPKVLLGGNHKKIKEWRMKH